MIQPGTDEDLDINYCYKIVLAGDDGTKGQEQKFGRKYGNIRILPIRGTDFFRKPKSDMRLAFSPSTGIQTLS